MVFGAIEFRRVPAKDIGACNSRHLFENGVDEKNMVAILRNQDALVERLENRFHLLEPFRFRDLHALCLRLARSGLS